MNKGFSSFSHPTYDDVSNACEHIAEFIHRNVSQIHGVDMIVGIARGGLIPAVIMSHKLNLPLQTIQYSSKNGAGDNKNHTNSLPQINAESILLVDDICDSGLTLKEVAEEYKSRGHKVFSAVIYYKQLSENKTTYVPDAWAVKVSKNFGWIHFPFEAK